MKKEIFIVLQILLFTAGNAQYLSDKDSIYRQIEDYQKNFGNVNHILKIEGIKYFTKENAFKIVEQADLLDSILFKDQKRLSANNRDLFNQLMPKYYPTRFQDPLTYLPIATKMNDIYLASKALYPSNTYLPKYGTFYSNSINAERKSYKDDYIILVHSNFIDFVSNEGKVSLQFLKNFSDVDSLKINNLEKYLDTTYINRIEADDKQNQSNYLTTFLQFNYPRIPVNDLLLVYNAKWLRQPLLTKALEYWHVANETFVLGHEYSHALLKHSTGNATFLNDTVLLQSWLNEVEADSLSQEILNKIVLNKKMDSSQMGWNKYLISGGIFYLNILQNFENDQSLLNSDKEIPSLTNQEHDSIIAIFENKKDLSRNLIRFSSLSPYLKKLDHPPTSIRIELINTLMSDLLDKGIYDHEEIYNNDQMNKFENLFKTLGLSMIYSLGQLDKDQKYAIHNAFMMRDYLFKNYN